MGITGKTEQKNRQVEIYGEIFFNLLLGLICLSFRVLMKSKVLLLMWVFLNTVWWKKKNPDIGTDSSFVIVDGIFKAFFNMKLLFFLHRKYRYIAYRWFVRWIFGVLGKNIRVPIPSCVVTAIYVKFPVKAG